VDNIMSYECVIINSIRAIAQPEGEACTRWDIKNGVIP
jgi:hypothetical protein